MSRFSDDFAESVVPNLLYHMGDSVTHYPQGKPASATTVTGIWNPESSSEDKSKGRLNARRGILQLDDSVTVRADDTWLISSELWSTESWRTMPGGMKEARLMKADQETRTSHGSSGKY